MRSRVYMHTAEDMSEIADESCKVLIGGSVFLGKGTPWDAYAELYRRVYVENGQRVIRKDGVFVVGQTNAYVDGEFLCRYKLLLDLLLPCGWRLIDERVWERRKADHFQVPFSHIMIFAPPDGTATRRNITESVAWLQGVWKYPQTKGGGIAGWPGTLSRMIVEALTERGDLVADPFAGTGRFLAEAARLGREGVGYEIDQKLVPILEENGCQVIQPTK